MSSHVNSAITGRINKVIGMLLLDEKDSAIASTRPSGARRRSDPEMRELAGRSDSSGFILRLFDDLLRYQLQLQTRCAPIPHAPLSSSKLV